MSVLGEALLTVENPSKDDVRDYFVYMTHMVYKTNTSIFRGVIRGPFIFKQHLEAGFDHILGHAFVIPDVFDQFEELVLHQWAVFVHLCRDTVGVPWPYSSLGCEL